MVKVRSKVLMPRLGLSTVIQLAQGTGGHGWSMVVKGWSRVVADGQWWSILGQRWTGLGLSTVIKRGQGYSNVEGCQGWIVYG